MNNFKKQKIINYYVNVITTESLLNEVKKFSLSDEGHYICVPAVHQIIESYNDEEFAKVANNADLALPDGRPVYWALKLLNHKDVDHLPGYYVTKKICKFAVDNNFKVGFYGGEVQTLNKCIANLKNEFKDLQINYSYSPPFRTLSDEEKKEIINNINNSEIKILFVCLGCPKQEYWMAEHKKLLSCTSIGIGAAIEFIAGTKTLGPKWIHTIGLFWFIRLISEPRRLFWRYFLTNFKFIYLFLKQYIKYKIKLK